MSATTTPLLSIRAYRKGRGAIVTVERRGQPARREQVSLECYRALRERLLQTGSFGGRTSGAFRRSSFEQHFWPMSAREVSNV